MLLRSTALRLSFGGLCLSLASTLTGCAAPAPTPERMVGVLGSPAQARTGTERKDEDKPTPPPSPATLVSQAASADAQAKLKAAEDAYTRGDWTAAAQGFRALTTTYPRNGQVWFGLGAASALSGNLEEASLAFETALRIDPKDAKAAYNLSLIRLSQAEIALGTATANSASTPTAVQAEITRLSRDMAPLFKRSSGSTALGAARPAPNNRLQDPARSGGAGSINATPSIPVLTNSR